MSHLESWVSQRGRHHQLYAFVFNSVRVCVCVTVPQQGELLHAAADRGVLLAGSTRGRHHPPDVDHPGPQITGARTHAYSHTYADAHTLSH